MDFKNLIKSEVTKFLKCNDISFECTKYDRKCPNRIEIFSKDINIIGDSVDKSHYKLVINYKY